MESDLNHIFICHVFLTRAVFIFRWFFHPITTFVFFVWRNPKYLFTKEKIRSTFTTCLTLCNVNNCFSPFTSISVLSTKGQFREENIFSRWENMSFLPWIVFRQQNVILSTLLSGENKAFHTAHSKNAFTFPVARVCKFLGARSVLVDQNVLLQIFNLTNEKFVTRLV